MPFSPSPWAPKKWRRSSIASCPCDDVGRSNVHAWENGGASLRLASLCSVTSGTRSLPVGSSIVTATALALGREIDVRVLKQPRLTSVAFRGIIHASWSGFLLG